MFVYIPPYISYVEPVLLQQWQHYGTVVCSGNFIRVSVRPSLTFAALKISVFYSKTFY